MGVVAAIYFIRIAVGGNKMNDVWFDVDNFRKVA
jgi:hypothetical protein